MTRVIITGAKGRMGQALIACAKNLASLELVAALGRNDSLAGVIDRCDVVIDFSSPHATEEFLALCRKHRKAIVVGTTGHSAVERAAIVEAATAIPVVLASNFSTGVNTLFWLTRKAAEILGTDFDL